VREPDSKKVREIEDQQECGKQNEHHDDERTQSVRTDQSPGIVRPWHGVGSHQWQQLMRGKPRLQNTLYKTL
jgi:hypothetical protein